MQGSYTWYFYPKALGSKGAGNSHPGQIKSQPALYGKLVIPQSLSIEKKQEEIQVTLHARLIHLEVLSHKFGNKGGRKLPSRPSQITASTLWETGDATVLTSY